MDIFLFTIMNTGTRAVKAWYEDQGHVVDYMHALPESQSYLENKKYQRRVTTLRNPKDVANSWLKGKRFNNCDWNGQWAWWSYVLFNYKFDDIIVLEDFKGPVVGKDDRPIVCDLPSDFYFKLDFAYTIIKLTAEKLENESCKAACKRYYQQR